MKRFILLFLAGSIAASSDAQQPEYQNEISLESYLEALGRISPVAREGADRFLQAYQRKCGKALPVKALRRAVAEGDGDPVLMAMIRAAAQQDAGALRTLSGSVSCAHRG